MKQKYRWSRRKCIAVTLDPEIIGEIDDLAKQENRSRSGMIETIIKLHLTGAIRPKIKNAL